MLKTHFDAMEWADGVHANWLGKRMLLSYFDVPLHNMLRRLWKVSLRASTGHEVLVKVP